MTVDSFPSSDQAASSCSGSSLRNESTQRVELGGQLGDLRSGGTPHVPAARTEPPLPHVDEHINGDRPTVAESVGEIAGFGGVLVSRCADLEQPLRICSTQQTKDRFELGLMLSSRFHLSSIDAVSPWTRLAENGHEFGRFV